MQTEVLQPAANVRAIAVWFPMYPADARARWPAEAITDLRVAQRWDASKVVGRFFLQHLRELGPRVVGGTYRGDADALWDAYLVFDAKGRWTGTMPDGLLSWGSTINQSRDHLAHEIEVAAGIGARR